MIALAAFVAIVVAAHASAATTDEYRAFAVDQAKLHVPGSMKNPRSAEFDDESVESVPLPDWGNGKTVWMRVGGVVRGTNAFNAIVPSRWSVSVAEVDGELQVGLIMVGSKVVHAGEAADLAVLELKRVAREQGEKARAELDALIAESAVAKERDSAAMRKEAERIRADIRARQESSDAQAESLRLKKIWRQGRNDGYAVITATGKARGRLTQSDIKKRASAAVKKARIPDEDAAEYVAGFISGAAVAKSGQPLTD